MKFVSQSEDDTVRFAQKLADKLEPGAVVALYGDLGVGKSVLCRALIRQLTRTPDLNVPSPTFSLVQTYQAQECDIWHFDFYRLEELEEIYELGWEEALAGNIVLIEWPEKIATLLPDDVIKVQIDEIDEVERRIKFTDNVIA